MSIYSGFATRQEESQYNKLISKMFQTLVHNILEFNLAISNKFSRKYFQLVHKLQNLEQHKYLNPKFSQIFRPLLCHIQNPFRQRQQIRNQKNNIRAKTQLQLVKQEENQEYDKQWNKKQQEQNQPQKNSAHLHLKSKARRSYSVLNQPINKIKSNIQQIKEERTFYYVGQKEPCKPTIKYLPTSKSINKKNQKHFSSINSSPNNKATKNRFFFKEKEKIRNLQAIKERRKDTILRKKKGVEMIESMISCEEKYYESSPNSISCKKKFQDKKNNSYFLHKHIN